MVMPQWESEPQRSEPQRSDEPDTTADFTHVEHDTYVEHDEPGGPVGAEGVEYMEQRPPPAQKTDEAPDRIYADTSPAVPTSGGGAFDPGWVEVRTFTPAEQVAHLAAVLRKFFAADLQIDRRQAFRDSVTRRFVESTDGWERLPDG
jgi:hypothetical protein